MVGHGMIAADVARRLDAAHRVALQQWVTDADGRSSCRRGGTDATDLQIKVSEGAAVALRDARRCVERGGRTPTEAIRFVLGQWQEMATFRRTPDWVAYVDGGRSALIRFLAELEAARPAGGAEPATPAPGQ